MVDEEAGDEQNEHKDEQELEQALLELEPNSAPPLGVEGLMGVERNALIWKRTWLKLE